MKTVINTLIVLAIFSQIALALPVKANTDINLANSTEKSFFDPFIGMLSVEKPALPVKPAVKAVSKRTASKAVVNSPGESIQLTLAEDQKPDKVMTVVMTAYNSVPGQTDSSPFIAATGKRVHDSMIAANKLPFGTKVVIPSLFGDKVFIVEDRMNSRYGLGRMDMWMESVPDAIQFGAKRVEVKIYYPEKVTKEIAKSGK